ncbi:MAG: helicase HerA-like domain-containing protein [Promethearchaeota archaeon]
MLGKNKATEEFVELKKKTLQRHVCTLGASGSGKTVFCKVIVEEATRMGIPSIIIDPQGDLASLGLLGDPEKIQEMSTPSEFAEEYQKNVEIRIWTPASSKGIPLCINPLQFSEEEMDVEDIIKTIDTIAITLIRFLGYDPENDTGKAAQTYLFQLLDYYREQKSPLDDLKTLAESVETPPESLKERASGVITSKEIRKLAKKIRFLATGATKLIFEMGIALDIDTFLTPVEAGKTPVNIIYLNTLNREADKHFFIATLGRQLYEWMLRHPKDEPQLIFYVDEIAPYLPPHPYNPPPKESLKRLMKQARKYGVSNLIATQNPADIDYKAMAQANTWVLGRMMTKQDISKVHHLLKSLNPAKANDIVAQLPKLAAGEFLLICPDEFKDNVIQFNARWLVTDHKTIDEDDIQDAMPEAVINYFKQKVAEQETRRMELRAEKEAELEKIIEDSAMAAEETTMSIAKEEEKEEEYIIEAEELFEDELELSLAMEEVPVDETIAVVEPVAREKVDELLESKLPETQINVYFMSTIGPGEKKHKLLIDTDHKVSAIKETVANLFGMIPTAFHLSHNGVIIDEKNVLTEYNLDDGDTVLLIPASTAG